MKSNGLTTSRKLRITHAADQADACVVATRNVQRRGFTLVELVVVVLVLGVIAAIATPKLFGTTATAEDNSLRQTLRVVRNAIELYRIQNDGALPGATTGTQNKFKNDLKPYLNADDFPAGPIGPAKGDNRIRMRNEGIPLSGNSNPVRHWRYDYTTGEFINNYNGTSETDPTLTYDQF